ncbi:MAG: GGDEF domain-containing protein [Candidatus Obscuribacterales bacterium]|nr:GGDEF domain-containing protein [Candidatus Obscuribacterales bacterium]
MPPRFTDKYEKAPRNRDSAFDRKLQQFRTTGEIDTNKKSMKSIMQGLAAHYEYRSMDSKAAIEDPKVSELERMAFIDPLTDSLNERSVLGELKDQIRRAERYKQALGVLILEVDDYERISSEAPAFAIDNLLRGVANMLRKSIREVDILGRSDGGKFILICPETSIGQLCVMGERLRNQFATSRLASIGYTLSVTVSGGVSSYPQTGKSADEVLAAATNALSQARKHGGNYLAEPNAEENVPTGLYGSFTVSNDDDPFHKDTVDFSPTGNDEREGEALLAALTKEKSTEVDTKATAEYVKPSPSMLKPPQASTISAELLS